ncbi:MAG TPA: L-threonylcarbamoyladenylate synthase, partial [Gammaproteobacteria bacterium]|nr:L-threonylcarbamoyladenylate synthase [Gammaproteobacteria bacterium]
MLKNTIQNGVKILKQGGLVAFPTETVYGLGGDAKNPLAIQKIFQAKNRPKNHPLIVHIGTIAEIATWAVDVSPFAWRLAEAFWPGPLTLILRSAQDVCLDVTGGQNTVGLRMPNHPLALELLQAFGGGVAAPSANRFQSISPTTKVAVLEELGDRVDLIIEGGHCEVGVESTIVDCSSDVPAILRPGMITSEDIARVLKIPLAVKNVHS